MSNEDARSDAAPTAPAKDDDHDHGSHAEQVIGYMLLRRAIGLLGIALPIWLWALDSILGAGPLPRASISAYYCTPAGDWFVGLLFAIGIFLFSYRGPKGEDAVPANLACAFALGVAVFPTCETTEPVRMLHFACAAALFLTLTWFCFKIFTRHGKSMTVMKQKRNTVYRVCGSIMLACLALIVAYKQFPDDNPVAWIRPVFWLETFALWAFGFSWITKGEMLMGDS